MRTLAGVVLGLMLAGAVLAGCGYGFLHLYPWPANLHDWQPEQIGRWLAAAPIEALLLLAGAWALAALLGGWIAARIAKPHRGGAALTIAVPLMLVVMASVALLPQPAWVPILGMLLPIPAALAAWRLAIPRAEL